MPDTAQIVKGEDRILTFAVKVKKIEGDPYDLTGFTKLTAEFRNSDNSILAKTTDLVGGAAATATFEGVTFTADSIGTDGNSISLVFNGSDTVDTVVNNWNSANPGNTVSHDGDGSEVLSSTTVNLSGGEDQNQFVTVQGDPLLGKIQVELTDTDTNGMRLGKSQSVRIKIDKGSTRRIAIFRNSIDVVNPEF